jgi:hypothetical protein
VVRAAVSINDVETAGCLLESNSSASVSAGTSKKILPNNTVPRGGRILESKTVLCGQIKNGNEIM